MVAVFTWMLTLQGIVIVHARNTHVRKHVDEKDAAIEVKQSGVLVRRSVRENDDLTDCCTDRTKDSWRAMDSPVADISKVQMLETTGFAADSFFAGDLDRLSFAQVQKLQDIAAGRTNKSQIEVVLAHYNEDLAWATPYRSVCTIYTKYPNLTDASEVQLPNVGREGHTFLHHIVANYDKLSEWTVFSQAGSPTVGYNGHRLGGGHMLPGVSFADYIVHDATNGNDGAFIFFTSVLHMDTLRVANRHSYNHRQGDNHPPRCATDNTGDFWDRFNTLGPFEGYLASRCNTTLAQLPEVFKAYWTNQVQSPFPPGGLAFYAQGARFAMTKERLHQRPKEYYQNLLDLVSSSDDPCANYFNEWTWFYQLGYAGNASACHVEAPNHPEVKI